MAFTVTANNLLRESEIKSLKLENEEYRVTIFYYGDYEKDRVCSKIDIQNISMSCKPKGRGLKLVLMSGRIMIDIPMSSILTIQEAEVYKLQFDIAIPAAIELEQILQEYFFRSFYG